MKKSRTKYTASVDASPPVQPPESTAALAGRMADEFNNILTTVMGACSLIDKDDPANGELLQCVALIRASAEHAADLSCRLMKASMMELDNIFPEGHGKNLGPLNTSVRDKKTINAIVSTKCPPRGALS